MFFSCADKLSEDECHTGSYTKITGDNSKRSGVIESMENRSHFLLKTVDEIVSANIELNDGIDLISKHIYTISSKICGETKQFKQYKYRRKFKSKWFSQACEKALREFVAANKMYRKSKTIQNRDAMISNRRSYRLAKRKAKHEYNNEQKERLHNLATNNPQSFWREIKKINVKRSKRSTISHDQFFEHFENLYSNSDGFSNDDVEEDISNIDDNINVEELDCDFTIEEVKRAISALKRGKSCGNDNIVPEAFIESSEIIAPIVCTLFNYMYSNNVYPSVWAKGVIVPMPKKEIQTMLIITGEAL